MARSTSVSYVVLLALLLLMSCDKPPAVNSPIHYTFTGSGEKTLVFIHGWCIDHTYWNDQVEYFDDSYQVLTVDLAGHGKSKVQRTDWTIDAYAADVADLINQLKLEKVILVGHSMSGNIALHIANKIPEKIVGFVGIDNLTELGIERNEAQLHQVDSLLDQMKIGFASKAEQFAQGGLFSETTSDSVKARVIADFQKSDPEMAVTTLKNLIREGSREKELAPKLKVPMLLLISDNGKIPLVDSASLTKYCGSGFRIATIKGTGHYPMIEAPEEFNRKLKELIEAK